MIRLAAFPAILLVFVLILVGLPAHADKTVPLRLDKECVIIGRIMGTEVMLYPVAQGRSRSEQVSGMARIGGFEVLNTNTGEWQTLELSKDGYFCTNVRMGEYDLRGRDSQGRPFLVHRFNVPLNMAVNLGTFWVDTSNPSTVQVDPWSNYERTASWREYKDGDGHILIRLEHDTSRQAYDDCESWFAGCHEKAYEHFEKVMARR